MKSAYKYILIIALLALISGGIYYFKFYHKDEAHSQEVYTCSMHPQIIRYEPGNCPICGMTLVKKKVSHDDADTNSIKELLQPTDKFIVGNFETTTPVDTTLSTVLDLPGYIEYDPNQSVNISARISGRIEKMFVNYKFQKISKGQKLFEIYSPELMTEQQNFIYLLNNDTDNIEIIKASKQKLLLYGMTSTQISNLEKNKRVIPVITIYSPVNGIVKTSQKENASSSMSGNVPTTDNLNVKEGDYIKKGETVFQLAGTDKVWAMFNILQGYNSLIKINQPITYIPEFDKEKTFDAKVGFVETQISGDNKSNRIRVYIDNPNNFPIGLRLHGHIKTSPVRGIWIERQSQVSIGNDKVVFVKSNNGFMVRKVSLGLEIGNYLQVLNGITTADTIAKNAQYLIDSESFIKTE